MHKLTVAFAALAIAATASVTPAAHGSPPADGPDGRVCGFLPTPEPQVGGTKSGYLVAGPMSWDREFRIHCTIQVDDAVHNGLSNDSTAHEHASSQQVDSGTHAGVVLPRRVLYTSQGISKDYLCTSVSYGTPETTLYWSPSGRGPDGIPGTADDDVAGEWSTNAARACTRFGGYTVAAIFEAIQEVVTDHVDPALCSMLQVLHDPAGPQITAAYYVDAEGDVFVNDHGGLSEARWRETLWSDCPGYVNYAVNPWAPGADGVPVIDY